LADGTYRVDVTELQAWTAATGRSGKPGRPDLVDEILRKQEVILPRDVATISPAELPDLLTWLAPLTQRLTGDDLNELCKVWSLCWECMLGSEMGVEAFTPFPADHWHEQFRIHQIAPERAVGFISWACSAWLDKRIGRNKWLAMLPGNDRKKWRRWLVKVDAERKQDAK
jgi:hypothetical protein